MRASRLAQSSSSLASADGKASSGAGSADVGAGSDSGSAEAATGTDAGTYPVTVTGTAVVKDSAGNDLTAQFIVNTEIFFIVWKSK